MRSKSRYESIFRAHETIVFSQKWCFNKVWCLNKVSRNPTQGSNVGKMTMFHQEECCGRWLVSSFHADRLMWLMAPGQRTCFPIQSSFWLLCTEYRTLKALDSWILSLDSYLMIFWLPLSVRSYQSIDITRIFLSCSLRHTQHNFYWKQMVFWHLAIAVCVIRFNSILILIALKRVFRSKSL